MKIKITNRKNTNVLFKFINLSNSYHIINHFIKKLIKRFLNPSNKFKVYTGQNFISLIIISSLWVQVPQWENDWSKCAVDIPDSSCHWYIKAPDNYYGNGFDWINAPWFDVNGLNDIAKIDKETVVEKLQRQ